MEKMKMNSEIDTDSSISEKASEVLTKGQTSRKDFLKNAALAGVGFGLAIPAISALAGCSNSGNPVTPTMSKYSSTDVAILATGYDVEIQVVNTYTAAAGLGKLPTTPIQSGSSSVLQIAQQFLADHNAHAAAF